MASILRTLGIKKGWPYFLAGFVLATYLKMDTIDRPAGSGRSCYSLHARREQHVPGFDKKEMQRGKLDNKLLRRVFFRSFTSMGSFNYKGYNNIGYVYSITPALKKIYENDPEGYEEALVRNCEFFNSHPYFSNLIMGASLALEEQKEKDGSVDGAAINSHKGSPHGTACRYWRFRCSREHIGLSFLQSEPVCV